VRKTEIRGYQEGSTRCRDICRGRLTFKIEGGGRAWHLLAKKLEKKIARLSIESWSLEYTLEHYGKRR